MGGERERERGLSRRGEESEWCEVEKEGKSVGYVPYGNFGPLREFGASDDEVMYENLRPVKCIAVSITMNGRIYVAKCSYSVQC